MRETQGVGLSGGLAKTEPASHRVQWREARPACTSHNLPANANSYGAKNILTFLLGLNSPLNPRDAVGYFCVPHEKSLTKDILGCW